MQPGDLEAGIVAGLEGAADWVDDAQAGRIDPVLMAEQLPRIIEHLTVYLEHAAVQGQPRRLRWLEALQTAEGL